MTLSRLFDLFRTLQHVWPSLVARFFVCYSGLSWSLLIVVAFVAWAITRNPAAAALVFCVRFAVPDALTAKWLLRNDSAFVRSKLLAALHGASSALKLAVASLVAAFFFDFVLKHYFPAAFVPAAGNLLLGPCVVGHILSLLLGIPSSTWLLLTGTRAWVSGGMLAAVSDGRWPPHPKTGFNAMNVFVVMYSAYVGIIGAALIYENSFGRLPLRQLPQQPRARLYFAVAAALIVLVATVILVLLVRTRTVAQTPQECWKDEADQVNPEISADTIPLDH